MKNLILILTLLIQTISFAQVPYGLIDGTQTPSTQMTVKQANINVDESWQVVKYNLQPIQDYLNQQISISKMNGKDVRATKLIQLKKSIYEALRIFRNSTIDSSFTSFQVDSLQVINKIKANAADISALKSLKLICTDCDTMIIGRKIFDLKNEKNTLIGYTKKWTRTK